MQMNVRWLQLHGLQEKLVNGADSQSTCVFRLLKYMAGINEQSVDRNGWRRRRLVCADPEMDLRAVPECTLAAERAASIEPRQSTRDSSWLSRLRSRSGSAETVLAGANADELAVLARRVTQKTLSPHVWKCCCMCGLLLLLPCLLLARLPAGEQVAATGTGEQVAEEALHAAAETMQEPSQVGADASSLNALHVAVGFELFLAAQLCLFISMVRGQSEVDFRGDYRVWKWLSIQLLVTAFLCAGSLLTALTDSLLSLLVPAAGSLSSARRVLWVVPAAAAFLVTSFRVISDMSRCRSSRLLMCCGLALGGSLVLLDLRGNLPVSSAYVAAIRLLSSGLILAAALLHAWFVFYVDRNPPSGRGRVLPLFRSAACSEDSMEHSAAA